MTWTSRNQRRVLAIDPGARGLGFAVFEGSECLVDWGLSGAKESNNRRCLDLLARFVTRYSPDVIVVEDCSRPSCRRGARAKELIFLVLKLATARKIKSTAVSRAMLDRAFAELEDVSKDKIARHIAERFPYLAPLVPPPRKLWMPEDARMPIFDAVAFGLAYFARGRKAPARQTDSESLAA